MICTNERIVFGTQTRKELQKKKKEKKISFKNLRVIFCNLTPKMADEEKTESTLTEKEEERKSVTNDLDILGQSWMRS